MALLMFLFHFVVDFVVAFPAPLSPYFIREYGLDGRTVAMGVAVLAFVGSFSQVLFAFRKQEKPWCQSYWGMSFTLIPMLFLVFPLPFLAVFAVFFLIYLADGYFHPLGAALSGVNRGGKGVTAFISGGILGGALGPVFITWFVSRYSLRSLSLVALCILVPLSLWFLRERKPSCELQKAAFSWRFFGILWPIWFMVSSRTFISAAFHTFVPIYVAEKGYSLLSGGALLTLGVLFGIPANILGSRMELYLTNGKLNLLSFLTLGVAVLAFTEAQRLAFLFFFYILADFATFLTMSTNVTEAQRLLPEHRLFASSIAMGFAWAFGHALNLLWASLFGNSALFILKSIGAIALGVALCVVLFERVATPKSAEVPWE